MVKSDKPKSDASMGAESWRKLSWSAIKGSVAWYFFVGLAVATLTPEQFVAQSSPIHFVTNLVARLVPAVPKFIMISQFPEITAFYFAIIWIALPIPILMIAYRWPPPPNPTIRNSIILLVGGAVSIACILGVFFILPLGEKFSLSYRRGQGIAFLALISQYRLGLGLLGSISFAILAGFVGVWLKFAWTRMTRFVSMLTGIQ